MGQTIPRSAIQNSLEERIFEGIRAWQQNYETYDMYLAQYQNLGAAERALQLPPSPPPRDLHLEGDIYQFLYKELRGIAAILPGMGPQAINTKIDVSCRFTSLLNKAFLRIIERCPDKLMRAQTRRQLTGFVSRVMSNMMLDHLRRKKTFRKMMETLGLTEAEDTQVRDILSHLADEKGKLFKKGTEVSFDRGLELILQWDESDDPLENDWAYVLRLRYVDGLGKDQIAKEMRIERSEVDNLLKQAKYHLRKGKS